jgi:hypothetical protein
MALFRLLTRLRHQNASPLQQRKLDQQPPAQRKNRRQFERHGKTALLQVSERIMRQYATHSRLAQLAVDFAGRDRRVGRRSCEKSSSFPVSEATAVFRAMAVFTRTGNAPNGQDGKLSVGPVTDPGRTVNSLGAYVLLCIYCHPTAQFLGRHVAPFGSAE